MNKFITLLITCCFTFVVNGCNDKSTSNPTQPKPQACGGIAGIKCPNNETCIDDPNDNCDPTKGGADCSGICKSN